MVDNNITMLGRPQSYHQDVFNKSEDPTLNKLAETYHNAYDWDEYDLFKSSCDRCNICKPTNTTNKTEY